VKRRKFPGDDLFPVSLLDHTVHLTGDLHCQLALHAAAAGRTDLELFERPGGDAALHSSDALD